MNWRVPYLLTLIAFVISAFLAGCHTSTSVSLDYLPGLGENLRGPRTIVLGRFADMRRQNAYQLGVVRTIWGGELDRITSRVPVDEVVRNAFYHGLSARGMLARTSERYVLCGEILDLHTEGIVRPTSYVRIRVKLVRSGSGQIVFSRVYAAERGHLSGSESRVSSVSQSISRALQDVVDRALDDRSLRDRMATSMSSRKYKSNVF